MLRLGERLEDPLLLFSVLLGVWVANFVAFNGDMVRELAAQFLELAYQHPAIAPRLVAHRLMGPLDSRFRFRGGVSFDVH